MKFKDSEQGTQLKMTEMIVVLRKTKIQIILVLDEFIYIYKVALKLLSNLKPYYDSPSNTNTNTSSPEMESYMYRSHDTDPMAS